MVNGTIGKPDAISAVKRGAGARNRIDRYTPFDARLHQFQARIRDAGRAGVGHHRDALPGFEALDQLRHPGARVVLVKADRSAS